MRNILSKAVMPINPARVTYPEFHEMLGYKFAEFAAKPSMWPSDARPSAMVTTYPVALQKAFEDWYYSPEYGDWWNELYDTTPMANLYHQHLHKAVDIAAQNQHYSESDIQALHNYADAFMQELLEPKLGIGTELCQEMFESWSHISTKNIQELLQIAPKQAEEARACVSTAAKVLAKYVPEGANFESVFSISGFVEIFTDGELHTRIPKEDVVREKCPAQATMLRHIMLAHEDGFYTTNEPVQEATQAEEFRQVLPQAAHELINTWPLKFDSLHLFHQADMSMDEVLGDCTEAYIEAFPELKEQFEHEAACYWQTKFGIPYSDEFTPEQIAHGFITSTPLVESIFDDITPLTNVMSLKERQDFINIFAQEYGEHPLDMAGAVMNAFGHWRNFHETNPLISGAFMMVGSDAMSRDTVAAKEHFTKLPPKTVVENALKILQDRSVDYEQSVAEYLGTSQDKCDQFIAQAHAYQYKPESDWSYTNLYTIAQDTLSRAGYQVWMSCVDAAVREYTKFGGYQFTNGTAQYIAENSRTTFEALPIELRAQLAQKLDETVPEQAVNLADYLKDAVQFLDASIQEQLANAFSEDMNSWEAYDLDMSDYLYD